MGNSWKDLVVWQKSHDMVLDIYKLIKDFPRTEVYSLVDQLKRVACSVPANIVEGHSKKSKKEFSRYLYSSRGFLEELRYFLLLARDLGYISKEKYSELEDKLTEISYLLNQLIKSITSSSSTTSTTSTTSKTSTTFTTSKTSRTSTTSKT